MVDTSLAKLVQEQHYHHVILDRPDSLNAINREMAEDLRTIWEHLTTETPAQPVLITGNGDGTCAGADLDIVQDDDFTMQNDYQDNLQRVYQLMEDYPHGIVMACQGATVGAGFAMTLNADFVILGQETVFSFPEINYGIVSNRTPALLAHLVGARAAKEIVLSGEPIPPARAKELGLVYQVTDEAAVTDRAIATVEMLAEKHPGAVKTVKDTVSFDFPSEAFNGTYHE